jgi:hypothetical protein
MCADSVCTHRLFHLAADHFGPIAVFAYQSRRLNTDVSGPSRPGTWMEAPARWLGALMAVRAAAVRRPHGCDPFRLISCYPGHTASIVVGGYSAVAPF